MKIMKIDIYINLLDRRRNRETLELFCKDTIEKKLAKYKQNRIALLKKLKISDTRNKVLAKDASEDENLDSP
jgi:hypothetical protein